MTPQPDAGGHFGPYGGRFVPEVLMAPVEELETAYLAARDMARNEGLLVGFSAGAAIWAARNLAQEIDQGVIVTILPDSGERYLSMGMGE